MKKFLFIFLIFLFCPIFVFAADKVDINIATLQQLDEIISIGPALAQRIIDARPFSSIDDLLRVKGIGEKTLQKIKDQGLACVVCQTTQSVLEARPPEPAAAGETAVSSSGEVGPLLAYATDVFINEIMPNPEGADESLEWFELFNSNNFDVDLSNWQIKDNAGNITAFTINPSAGSGQAKILANNFLVFKRPETKIMLNNDTDRLSLLTPDAKIVDSVNFTKAPLGQSYNKINSNWAWSVSSTPGAQNIITAKTGSAKALPKNNNSVKNNNIEAGLASLSLPAEPGQTTNPWFLFLTALVITIISAFAVLFIKLKFKKHVRT